MRDLPTPADAGRSPSRDDDRPLTSAQDLERLGFARHHAFVVGIDAYQHVAPLKTAVADARQLADVLATLHHFTVHPPLLDATGAELRALLHDTLSPARFGPNDRVLFYFAGHGIAADGDDGPAGFLVPADAPEGTTDGLLPMAELQAALDALPCRHLLVILDCCFSGAFKWSTRHRAIGSLLPKRIYAERFDRFAADPARQIITSAAHDQKALDVLAGRATGERGAVEQDGGLHSPFALALFRGLAGAADVSNERETDGVITATELYAYIRDEVEPATIRADQRLRQTPSFFPLAGHDKGEFMFLNPHHRLNLPAMPRRSPYKGLASFDETDRHLFYGRDRVIAELRARAADPACRLLVVTGPSGTGKSSVIKAGLLPVLRAAGCTILSVMRPGDHPAAELQRVLEQAPTASGGSGAVLVIDQFEEVITRCADPQERVEFDLQLAALLAEGSPVGRLIVTVRSDFEPQVNGGALKAAWLAGRCTVPPFSLEELRELIVMPTVQEVLVFEPPELVGDIIGEVVQSPGALPLLSYALNELYEAYVAGGRSDRTLTRADYDKLGGVMGALRTRADLLYQGLTDDLERDIMRRIMLRMVSVEGELAGRRVRIADLVFDDADAGQVGRVVERMVEARLVVRQADTLEPAHDALVRAWKTLLDWIHAARRDRLILASRLGVDADAYAQHRRNPEYLWHDNPNLPAMREVLQDRRVGWLVQQEVEFIGHSVRRRRRRTLTLVGITAAVIASLATLAGFAWKEKTRVDGTVTEARGFTDGLMFDVVDQLDDLPQTAHARRSLLHKVGELHEKLGAVGAGDDASTIYWRTLLEGDIDREENRLDEARAHYVSAQKLADAAQADPSWQRNLSIVYGRLGALALRDQMGAQDRAAALEFNDRALAIDRHLAEISADNRVVQRDLMVSYLKSGLLHEKLYGDTEPVDRNGLLRGREHYAQARRIAQELAVHPQADGRARREAVSSFISSGNIAYKLAATLAPADADANEASEMYQQALASAQRWSDEALTRNERLQGGLFDSAYLLGTIEVERRQSAAARSSVNQALTILAAQSPSVQAADEWARRAVAAYSLLGSIETKAGRIAAARGALREAMNRATAEDQRAHLKKEIASLNRPPRR